MKNYLVILSLVEIHLTKTILSFHRVKMTGSWKQSQLLEGQHLVGRKQNPPNQSQSHPNQSSLNKSPPNPNHLFMHLNKSSCLERSRRIQTPTPRHQRNSHRSTSTGGALCCTRVRRQAARFSNGDRLLPLVTPTERRSGLRCCGAIGNST